MKKVIVILMSMIMVLGIIGCSNLEEPTNNEAVVSEDASDVEGVVEESTDEDEFIVGFLFDSYADDAGWGYEHNLGRLALEEAGIKTIYKESVPTTQDSEKVMQDFINQGADVIIGCSFGYMDYLDEMALQNSEVIFLHCGGYLNEDNFYNYLGRQYESRFLSGIVAASVSETNKLGYVAAYEMPEVIRQINAYTLGAQLVNPDIEVEVVWTHTWNDASIEKAAGQTLIDSGCDVLTCHETTSASLMPAEETEGVYAIGYTTDISGLLPTSYLTSSAFNWGAYYVPTIEAIKEGTWEKGNAWLGLAEEMVQLTPYSDVVPSSAVALVEEYQEKIISKEFAIFAGPIYAQDGTVLVEEGVTLTDEDLLNMMYFVKGVVGNIE
jgi:basic membrane protein A